MTASAWLAKARRALAGGQELLESGDFEGAVNRSYYAMFNAARAALLAVGQNEAAMAKTHRGLIGTFGKYLIVTGMIDLPHGRALTEAYQRRVIADYEMQDIERDEASLAVASAIRMIDAVGRMIDGLAKE